MKNTETDIINPAALSRFAGSGDSDIVQRKIRSKKIDRTLYDAIKKAIEKGVEMFLAEIKPDE